MDRPQLSIGADHQFESSAAATVALVIDVPGLWRRLGTAGWPAEWVFADFYRIVLIVIFGALWFIHRRNQPVRAAFMRQG